MDCARLAGAELAGGAYCGLDGAVGGEEADYGRTGSRVRIWSTGNQVSMRGGGKESCCTHDPVTINGSLSQVWTIWQSWSWALHWTWFRGSRMDSSIGVAIVSVVTEAMKIMANRLPGSMFSSRILGKKS